MPRVAIYKSGAFHTVAGTDVPATHGRFRNSNNTGLPYGTTLSNPEAELIITTSGTVVENRHIYGRVIITAPDVVIRNCRIENRFGGTFGVDTTSVPSSLIGNAYSLEIQDCDLIGGVLGVAASISIGSNTAVRRCRISHGDDGAKISGNNILLEDSWIYEQVQYPGGHDDALQTSGGDNIIIRRNKLEVNNVEFDTMYNSCFQIGSLAGDLTNLTFEDNYVDGGNIMINGTLTSGGGVIVSNAVFQRNRFGPNFRTGYTRSEVKSGDGAVWSTSNVNDLTGVPV